jgi:tetratricopeptide (TPR) repeat protein
MSELKLRKITDGQPVSETSPAGMSMTDENKDELKNPAASFKATERVDEDSLTVRQDKVSVIRSQNVEPVTKTTEELSQAAALEAAAKPPKDIWDKLMAISPIISGMLIFIAGGVFTYTYNQQQLRVQEIQTIEKFIPHLTGSEQSKKAAILAINSLTDAKLAGKIASLYASQGTVSALQSMTKSGNDNERAIAQQALTKTLDTLRERENRLDNMESAYRKALAGGLDDNGDNAEQTRTADSDTPTNLIGMAAQYKNLGQNALAEQLLKRALSLVEKKNGAESQEAADIWRRLAEVHAAQGNRSQSEICLKRAKAIDAKQSPNPKAPAEQLQENPAHEAEPTSESSDADTESTPKKVEKPAADLRRAQSYSEQTFDRYMHLPDLKRNLNL